ncbi:minor pilin and initiator protein [Stenotrophomonas maltophilia]|uniref:Minor pilin and initiator protein n=1 Tax=Stenotrophomonas maltophilia TaxID=40324 RepID=A0AAX1IDP3_STEMA|nr:CfaE/CblD family pilus tip adhesin [Stenotrophomonas maltophilia]QGL81720.1 pilin protein [Stenotrophomonas maltophilia]QNG77998.1 minor pilin and initiator protein [Stenotrophomonas maltophilia]
MSRRWMCVLMLVCALVLVMPRAWTQRLPETDPPSGVIGQDINMAWDRSAMPGDIEIWAPKTLIAHEGTGTAGYGHLFLTCASETDSSTGKCATEDTHESARGILSRVPVRLTERRGGMPAEVTVKGALYRIDPVTWCSSDYWHRERYTLYSSYAQTCLGEPVVGTGASLLLEADELQGLTAGHWQGKLELDLRKPPSQSLAKYVFNFDFTVTDYDAITIYFPGFDGIAPLVNMDLRYDPIRKVVAGRKEVDMCLYDGVGSQSEFLGVTVRDSGPRPPPGRDFAVWHQDGGSDDAQRLDYHVRLSYGGNELAMKHGEEQLLRGIDSAQLRMVLLPGISQPVYCVPTPLTLETPPTPIASQRPGIYEGELTVELRVPTAKP